MTSVLRFASFHSLSYFKKVSLGYSITYFDLLNLFALFFTTLLGNWREGFILECRMYPGYKFFIHGRGTINWCE